MKDLRSLDTATFRRGEISRSTIDYIYLSQDLVINYVDADVEFLNPNWSDHTLLQVTCKFDFVDDTGPGLWRANPIYTSNKEYRQQLASMLTRLYDQEIANSVLPPQDIWDLVKLKVKQFTKSFGRHYVDWRKQQILALQRKRQRLLRSSFPSALLATHLPRVEQQIQALQEEVTSIAILKAERTWRERGEMDAGYLKRSATARAVQRSIPRLWDPDNGDICSSRTQMLDVAQKFYAKLYSPEPVCSSALEAMVSKIPSSCRLSKEDSEFMTSSFLLDEILDQTSRSPKISSPGTDGLSYAFLKLIFKHPKYSDLIGRVYNDAISSSLFPQSWLQTCVCLLPKKGDLTRLQNWRSITLINCDAKIFTRLLNARMVTMIPSLISPWQSGFMKERFIADNGALAQIAIEQASLRNSDEIGLLCDQEKAYDRVHPTYLQAVLNRYGFPNKFTAAITNLFYNTSMCVNINGYLTLPVSLGRGLRQGDPISPLLFNLVLEPLVKAISDSPVIRGFGPPSLSLQTIRDPLHGPSAIQPLKVLAYADDLLLFLRDPADLEATQQLIHCYNLASNAKMNFDKTIAFSVSGLPHPHWPPVLAAHGITKWHDRRSIEPLTYLGYPLVHSTTQRQFFQDQMITKIARACDIHKQRNLSFRGRATVLNTLILSTLWHILRVSWVSQRTLGSIRRICREFLMFRIFPPVSFDILCLPFTKGGLGILDPYVQQLALQFRWLTPLLQNTSLPTVVSQWIAAHMASVSPLVLLDHRLPFLFPPMRRGSLHSSKPSICSTLFKAFDALLEPSAISMALKATFGQPNPVPLHFCLTLPLSAIISWSSAVSIAEQRTFDSLLVSDAFVFDDLLMCLRPKASTMDSQPVVIGRYRVNKLMRWISSGTVSLVPFFALHCLPSASCPSLSGADDCFDSLLESLLIKFIDTRTQMVSPKLFRRVRRTRILRSFPSTSVVRTCPASFWRSFWGQPVPLAARNPWYRLLHQKLPCAALVHKIIPDLCSSFCRLCDQPTIAEDAGHFFVSCPVKFQVWTQIWSLYFGCEVNSQIILQALYDLRFPRQRLALINNGSIIGCTPLGIWKAHWRFIYDGVPFVPDIVFHSILLSIGPFRTDTCESHL